MNRTESMIHDLNHSPGNPRNSEGAFLPGADGSIRFLYTRYTGESWHDDASADIAQVVSKDQGATWSEPEVVLRHSGSGNIMSVSLLRLASGEVLLGYLAKRCAPSGELSCVPVVRRSSDEGKSWSDEQCLYPSGYYVLNNDRVIQCASGRLVMPLAQHTRRIDGSTRPGFVVVLVSDDEGRSWQESPTVLFPDAVNERHHGFEEPGVIELTPGHLLLWMRTAYGWQYMSHSDDDGMTWSTPAPARDFPSPASPLSMKRSPYDHALYAIFNGSDAMRWPVLPNPIGNGRTPLVLMRSFDDARSWDAPNSVMLEQDPDRGYCYTAIQFLPDRMLLGYCFGRHGGGSSCLQDLRIRTDISL